MPVSSQDLGDASCRYAPPPNLRKTIEIVPGASTELIPHAGKRWMGPVLDLNPAIGPAAAVDAFAALGDHALRPHQAGVAEQVRAVLALLERRDRRYR